MYSHCGLENHVIGEAPMLAQILFRSENPVFASRLISIGFGILLSTLFLVGSSLLWFTPFTSLWDMSVLGIIFATLFGGWSLRPKRANYSRVWVNREYITFWEMNIDGRSRSIKKTTFPELLRDTRMKTLLWFVLFLILQGVGATFGTTLELLLRSWEST